MDIFQKATGKSSIEFVESIKKPIVRISTHALVKMKQYVDQSSEEIGWIGIVDSITHEGIIHYLITDVMLVPQDVSSATTDLCEKGLSELGTTLLQEGKMELFNKVRMWGHSHVNMAVFASGTDDKTFEDFYANSDFFIRVICNKKGDMSVDFMDCINGIKYLNLDWYELKTKEHRELQDLIEEFNERFEAYRKTVAESVKEEIAKNIKKKTYTSYVGTALNKFNGYTNEYDDEVVTYSEKKTETKVEKEETIDDCISIYKEDYYDVAVYTDSNGWGYLGLDVIYTFDEIEQFMTVTTGDNYAKTVKELQECSKNIPYFKNYTEIQWDDLYEIMEAYYWDFIQYGEEEVVTKKGVVV